MGLLDMDFESERLLQECKAATGRDWNRIAIPGEGQLAKLYL